MGRPKGRKSKKRKISEEDDEEIKSDNSVFQGRMRRTKQKRDEIQNEDDVGRANKNKSSNDVSHEANVSLFGELPSTNPPDFLLNQIDHTSNNRISANVIGSMEQPIPQMNMSDLSVSLSDDEDKMNENQNNNYQNPCSVTDFLYQYLHPTIQSFFMVNSTTEYISSDIPVFSLVDSLITLLNQYNIE
ncbi:hypothetical protein WA158_002268 [Blastocystis sp. Blastoise]